MGIWDWPPQDVQVVVEIEVKIGQQDIITMGKVGRQTTTKGKNGGTVALVSQSLAWFLDLSQFSGPCAMRGGGQVPREKEPATQVL